MSKKSQNKLSSVVSELSRMVSADSLTNMGGVVRSLQVAITLLDTAKDLVEREQYTKALEILYDMPSLKRAHDYIEMFKADVETREKNS